jgi:hypothetical protein
MTEDKSSKNDKFLGYYPSQILFEETFRWTLSLCPHVEDSLRWAQSV